MLENEIIPLYFAQNSLGYSPNWIQYIKNSIGHIAPNFTMKRMIDDYITRFYAPEAARYSALAENDYALAKELVDWKTKFVEAWNGINVLDFNVNNPAAATTGNEFSVDAKIDTNGLGKDLGLELVVFKNEDGVESFVESQAFEVVSEENGVLNYHLTKTIEDAGVYRYGYRLYPVNSKLPHRQDFAYVRWI